MRVARPAVMEPSKNISSTSDPTHVMEGVTSDAKELASDVVDRGKELASEQVSKQREKSAREIVRLADALHHTTEELGDAFAASYVDRAASALDRLSESVRDGDVRDVVRATERFARKEPLLFLGGAFAVGLIAARFLKSSEQRREHDQISEQRDDVLGRR